MKKLFRCSSVISANLDGELVLLSLERDMYFGAKSVGARIWELLERPLSIIELVEHLRLEYAVDVEECRADVEEFVRSLTAAGLVEWVD